ncbi:MAG: methyltransferase domain-containing protein [Variovorax sp.]|nr:MAG: methyltransferase domain-containing protein [Variovorax sp.]
MATSDPFGTTDTLDEATLQAIATRLEARGQHPLFTQMLQEYLDAMPIDAAGTVLDMGCGTGLAARAMARRPGFRGHVTGVDLSPYLVEAATRLAADEGLGSRAGFQVGDTRKLALADQSFDAVVAHTLVSHVEQPLAVVREAARLVKRGGVVAIFDGDYASMTFGHADADAGKRYDEALIRAIVASPRVMRQMPRLLRGSGLELVATFPHMLAEIGRADFWLSGIQAFRVLIVKAGVMGKEEVDAWADTLIRDSDEGVFFGACNYYSFVARRP